MKKFLILIFVIIFSNLVSAGLYPVSVADLIQPSCNNNGVCDYFENSARCPNECGNQNVNTVNNVATSSTTIETVENTAPNIENQQVNTNIENNEAPKTNIIKKQSSNIPWNLILSIGFVIGIILLVSVLYLWIKENKSEPISTRGKGGTSTKGKQKGIEIKKFRTNEENEFGLPSRPKRGFGV